MEVRELIQKLEKYEGWETVYIDFGAGNERSDVEDIYTPDYFIDDCGDPQDPGVMIRVN